MEKSNKTYNNFYCLLLVREKKTHEQIFNLLRKKFQLQNEKKVIFYKTKTENMDISKNLKKT